MTDSIIEHIGQLAYARTDYKQIMAEGLGISRNYLDKLLTLEKLETKDRLMLVGFIDMTAADLRRRAAELEEIKANATGQGQTKEQ